MPLRPAGDQLALAPPMMRMFWIKAYVRKAEAMLTTVVHFRSPC